MPQKLEFADDYGTSVIPDGELSAVAPQIDELQLLVRPQVITSERQPAELEPQQSVARRRKRVRNEQLAEGMDMMEMGMGYEGPAPLQQRAVAVDQSGLGGMAGGAAWAWRWRS